MTRRLPSRVAGQQALVLAALGIALAVALAVSTSRNGHARYAPAGLLPAMVELSLDGTPPQATNLMPGASLTQRIEVRNVSWIPIRYWLMYETRPISGRADLANGVHLELRLAGTGCEAFDGLLLAQGSLAGMSASATRAGVLAGDRELGVGQSETFCARLGLRVAAGNELQGNGVSVRLAARAELGTRR